MPQREIVGITFDIQRLQRLLPDLPDGPARQQTLAQLSHLEWLLVRYRNDLRDLAREADVVERQLARLAQQRLEIQANHQRQLNEIAGRVTQLEQSVRRIEGQQRRLVGPARADTREARALAAQAGSISTYDELPLESIKADFLAELQAHGR